MIRRIISDRMLFATWVLTMSACQGATAQDLLLVETGTVKEAGQGVHHTLHCQVTAPFLHQIASEADAKLVWSLPVGSKVTKGQLIAEQDDYYLNLRLAEVEIALQQASADLHYSQSEYQRLASLKQDNLVAASRLSEFQLQLQTSQTTIARLNNNRQELTYRKRHLKHYSPGAGEIVAIQAQPGERVATGATILHLQAKKDKELQCKLPLELYVASDDLREAVFTLDDDAPLTLLRHSEQLQFSDQTLNIYLQPEADESDALFFSQRLHANLYFQRRHISRIPHNTLTQDLTHRFVWKLDKQNRVSKVDVDIIATESEHFVVAAPLEPDDRLVALGKDKLREGQTVRIVGNDKRIARMEYNGKQ